MTAVAPAAGGPIPPDAGRAAAVSRMPRDWLGIVVPALIAYVPLLLTQPGQVGADTKTYLYLDPGRLLRDAPYIWDSQIGLGTVTHQNIGYLWPMGPFYWVLDRVGVPDWMAQRLWLGTVLFAAGLGVRYLVRTLGTRGFADRSGAVLVASLAYMLSPYLLEYSARISVILLPWAALPWLIALTAKALRHGGWRYPALFALVVLTVGGVNATALLLVGVGPLLWVVHEVWFTHDVPWRDAWRAVWRIGVLTLLTSLWWMAGLWVQGKYGLPVLRYTETYKTVAEVSTAPEVLRGLGYWFFYGNDKLGPWIEPSVTYTQNLPILVLSYGLALTSLLAAALVRWRYRAYFLLMLVAGALMAIGSHPWDESSPFGAAFKLFSRTNAGLAMRSTPRAVPLVVLATALFLGAGVAAVGRRLPRFATPITVLVALLVVANLPTLWTGQMVAKNLKRPEDIPEYWKQAIAYLDAQGYDTRMLEVPGADFASYRWGNTVDPITPGLTDRGYVARELFQWGTPGSANLVNAFDRRFHEDVMDPRAIAIVAQVMGAGDVTYRADLQYERYRTARPRPMWDLLRRAPGLDPPVTFGEPTPNRAGPEQPMIDEVELDDIDRLADPPPVSVFPVTDALPIVRAQAAERPLMMAGDGDGLVDAAGAGVLDPTQALFYSASYAQDPSGFDQIYGQDADLLLTDTNRKRARRWGTLRETTGYTERAGETPSHYDPGDQRLDLFPGAGDDAYTVSEQRGGVLVTASDYGNPITYTPNDRAANAVDGDPLTAWRVGAVDDPIGQTLTIRTTDPVTTDHVTLLQPINLVRNRWITKARLRFDDGPPLDVTLDDSSRTQPGQRVSFPSATFSKLTIEVRDTNIPKRPRYDGISGVGFAEVGIPGVRVDELIRPPTDLLDQAGPSSLGHRLTMLFTRLRSNPSEPVRTDEEVNIARVVSLPTARTFAIAAQARLSAYVPDDAIDRLLGLPDASQGGLTVTSEERLAGSPARRGSAAFDGDPTTHWSGRFLQQQGQYVQVTTPAPVTFDHLDMQVVADGRHSVPTRFQLVVDGDTANPVPVEVPPITDQDQPSGTVAVRVDLPRAVTGSTFRFVIDDVRPTETVDWYSNNDVTMPVAIAEFGIPGVQRAPLPERFDSGCRTDLLSVDGTPVPLRVTGTTQDAIDKRPLDVEPCAGADALVTSMAAGEHVIRTGIGRDLGFDLDQLSFSSAAGGSALSATERAATPPPSGPSSEVVDRGPVSYTVDVQAQGQPFWLAVGQSFSPGWHATVDGKDLGPPQMINGYGNGWLVDPQGAQSVTIRVEWTPQRVVWFFLAVSAAGVLLCLALALLGRRPPKGASAAVVTADPLLDPSVDWPWRQPAGATSGRAAGWAGLGLAVFAFLNLPFTGWAPAWALALGIGTWWAFRARRGRSWLALAGLASLALADLYIVTSQWRHRHIPDFIWPLQFDRVHTLGLMTLFLLLAEAVRELVIARGGPDLESAAPGADNSSVGPEPPTI